MGPGYFLYHGIRLARQALAARREARRAATPLPGYNPGGVTAADVARAMAAMDRMQAKDAESVRVWGKHPFVMATPANNPEGLREEWYRRCVTCRGHNDGVVHEPTWGRYPDGSLKPEDVRFRNELVKGGVSEDEAVVWAAAWEAEAARQGIAKGSAGYWDRAGSTWIHNQRRAGMTPS